MRFRVGLVLAVTAILAALTGATALASSPAVGLQPVQRIAGPDLPGTGGSSAERRGASASGTITKRRLARRLRSLSRQAPGASGFYVYDVDAGRKRVLFERKVGKRRKLASNTKLFTTATALNRFGPRGWLETTAVHKGRLTAAGRLTGDLYLIGDGDPALGSSGMNELATEVKRAGVKRIAGDLIADDSIFDRRRGVPDSGYGPSPYIAPLSGLVYGGSTYSGDPALAALAYFRKALRGRGVKLNGKQRLGRLPDALADREPLGTTRSLKMSDLVAATNKPSNNFIAEMLLKRLSTRGNRPGTTRRGTRKVERFARGEGSGVDSRDGSGLTDNNRSSPREVVSLLSAMTRHPARRAFYRSLAIAGKDGTLADRMRGTSAQGRCRGKTGTITGVSALSGYCRAGRGGKVAFSLLMNSVGDTTRARAIQDKMVIEISRYRP